MTVARCSRNTASVNVWLLNTGTYPHGWRSAEHWERAILGMPRMPALGDSLIKTLV